MRRTRGEGTSADSEFELALALPGAADGPLELARVGDELVVAVGGVRRLVALPSVLRRCTVTAALLGRRRPVRHLRPRPRGLDAMTSPGCDAHAGASAELRALARTALDRVEPVLDRLRIEPSTPVSPETCAVCPLCALMAALRGERPELVQRLAEHLGGLVTLLRTALDETRRARPAGAHRVGQPEGRAADPRRATGAGGGR